MILNDIFQKVRNKIAFLYFLLLILLLAGCSTYPEDCAGVPGGSAVEDCNGVCGGEAMYDECKVTWELIQENIFIPQCVSCHTSGTSYAQISGLVLTSDSAYMQLIDVPNRNEFANDDGYVRVSSSGGLTGLNSSFLWEKINALNEDHFNSDHPYFGELMPLGANYLTNGQLALVEKWIMEGAPELGVIADPNLLIDTSVYKSPEFVELEPPQSGYQYHLGPFYILPQREREILYYIPPQSTEDIFIERVQISMRPGSHHFIIYTFNDDISLYLPEPYTIRNIYNGVGNYISDNIIAMLFHKFITGTQWPALDYHFPEGIALRVPPDFGFDLNSHYVNYTDEVIVGEIYANIHTIPESNIDHVAEILFLNNDEFSLPPGEITTVERIYTFNQILENSELPPDAEKLHIFQLFSHAHKHLIQFDIDFFDNQGNTDLIYTALDWEHPPILELNPPLTLSPDEGLKMVVTYNNWTDDSLKFGLLSEDEMMIIFGYVYTE